MVLKKSIKYKKTGLILILLIICSCKKEYSLCIQGCNDPIIIPFSTSDTILNVYVKGDYIPVYISIPKCKTSGLPAVVLLHGSGGMWKDNNISSGIMSKQNREWRDILDANCIVGVYVDSYTPRGCIERTGDWKEAPKAFKISSQFVRPYDAYASLEILGSLVRPDGSKIVRVNDVGLLGFSDGATALAATLYDTENTPNGWKWTQSYDKTYTEKDGIGKPAERPSSGGFACGVFYYGGSVGNSYWGGNPCDSPGNYIYRNYAPILYQLPENGYLTTNTLCSYFILEEEGLPVEKFVYSNTTHGFDGNEGDEMTQSIDARTNTIEWLRQHLHIN